MKIGDSGLVVDYVNYRLGINSNKFTEESVARLKQFQASYGQLFIDRTEEETYFTNHATGEVSIIDNNYSPYDSYFKPGDNYYEIAPLLSIYPNGSVDIYTMPALTGTEIELYNTLKIKQVQKALSETVYSDYQIIPDTYTYNQELQEAIRRFQYYNYLDQPFIPIVEHKNLIPSGSEYWSHIQIDKDAGTEEPNFNIITSDFIELDFNFEHYIKLFTPGYNILVYFYNKNYQYINETAVLADYNNSTDFIPWMAETSIIEGKIPYCDTQLDSKAHYIRVGVFGSDISIQTAEWIQIQLERSTKPTNYEPHSLTDFNVFYTGYLNIPTYNAIKKEFDLIEVT